MRCWAITPLVWSARVVARLPQRLLLTLGETQIGRVHV